jgi:hypothetical protein
MSSITFVFNPDTNGKFVKHKDSGDCLGNSYCKGMIRTTILNLPYTSLRIYANIDGVDTMVGSVDNPPIDGTSVYIRLDRGNIPIHTVPTSYNFSYLATTDTESMGPFLIGTFDVELSGIVETNDIPTPSITLDIPLALNVKTSTYSYNVTRSSVPVLITVSQGGSTTINHTAVVSSTSTFLYNLNATYKITYNDPSGLYGVVNGTISWSYDNFTWTGQQSITNITSGSFRSGILGGILPIVGDPSQTVIYIKFDLQTSNLGYSTTVSANRPIVQTETAINGSVSFSDTVIPSRTINQVDTPKTLTTITHFTGIVCGPATSNYTSIITWLLHAVSASSSATITIVCVNCIRNKSYWKSHPDDPAWLVLPDGKDTPFFSSRSSYFENLCSHRPRNSYYVLSREYVTALMNVSSGAVMPAEVQAAFDASTGLFTDHGPCDIIGLKCCDPLRQQFIINADILSGYNSGVNGPQVCGLTV